MDSLFHWRSLSTSDLPLASEKERKKEKQTRQTRDGTRTGSPPARAGFWKDDQGHRGTGVGSERTNAWPAGSPTLSGTLGLSRAGRTPIALRSHAPLAPSHSRDGASTFLGSSWFDRSSPWPKRPSPPAPQVKTAPSASSSADKATTRRPAATTALSSTSLSSTAATRATVTTARRPTATARSPTA